MKANELMLGDFVFHEKYGNAITETIDNDFGDNPSVKLISENIKHKDGYKYGYCWCDLDEIFPIPLTPEILEKNGWEYNNYNNETENEEEYYVDRDGFDIHINGEKFEIRCIDAVNIQLKYLHELQHALKLCGIDKTIEL